MQNSQIESLTVTATKTAPSRFGEPHASEGTVSIIGPPGSRAERVERLITGRAKDLRVERASTLSRVASQADVIILDVTDSLASGDRLGQALAKIRQRHGTTPVMLIVEEDDPSFARDALRMGARGLVPTALSGAIVTAAVRLVLAGGTFISPDLVDLWGSQRPTAPAVPPRRARSAAQLTQREMEILEEVRTGHPNKIIAYTLQLSESTVKTHLRNIMRKARAKNRTELALFVDAGPQQ